MHTLPKISCALVLGLLVWATPAAHAQTTTLPPWMNKRVENPAPQPAPQPTQTNGTVLGDVLPEVFGRPARNDDRNYDNSRNRKGHPHGMPPGQAKKRGYRANPSNGGLPPGQARTVDNRRYDDRNYRRDDDDRYRNYRRDDDDRNKGGKGKGKGKGRD